MEINNLSQFKKAINAKTPFIIIEHYIHPQYTGTVRIPSVLQTNGFYSKAKDEPRNPQSLANNGAGVWMGYGKASDWEFDGETIKAYHRWKPSNSDTEKVEPIMKIKFIV
jgi:hypothetical protein